MNRWWPQFGADVGVGVGIRSGGPAETSVVCVPMRHSEMDAMDAMDAMNGKKVAMEEGATWRS